jgi:phage-related protein
MPETFTWIPQTGFSGEDTPDVTVVKLGDRYEQRQLNGINPLMGKYPLTFIGYDDTKCLRPNIAKAARDFLKARMAVESCLWTPYDNGIKGL